MNNNVDYGLSQEDQSILDNNIEKLFKEIREKKKTLQDLSEITKLLEVNKENFERYKTKSWFKKAWFVISGNRGKLTDITVNNLGKVHIGVIKVLGNILEDSSEIKEDTLSLFSHIHKIKSDSVSIRYLLQKFNDKYNVKYKKLRDEIRQTNIFLRVTQAVMGLGLIIGATLQFIPGLAEQYWLLGLISCGVAGTSLIGLSIVGIERRIKAKQPIPVAVKETIKLPGDYENRQLEQTLYYLGLGEKSENFKEEPIDNRVFKVQNDVKELLDYFQLTKEELRLLFSLEYYISSVDAEKTVEQESRKKKFKWIDDWQKSVNSSLSKPIVSNSDELFLGLEEICKENLPIPKLGTILLEASIFTPYFRLAENQSYEELKFDVDKKEEQVEKLCRAVGFNKYLLDEGKKAYNEALEGIPPSNFWRNVLIMVSVAILIGITGGIAAPVIGGIIGGLMGLSGAAAVSSGLAFLGGGAIAAGGFGMAGGTAVLIGGGALLGAGLGAGSASLMGLFSNSSQLVLRELSKLEAISKVFLIQLSSAKDVISSIISKERVMKDEMSKEILNLKKLKKLSKENKRILKELEIGIEFCDSANKRLEKYIEENKL